MQADLEVNKTRIITYHPEPLGQSDTGLTTRREAGQGNGVALTYCKTGRRAPDEAKFRVWGGSKFRTRLFENRSG